MEKKATLLLTFCLTVFAPLCQAGLGDLFRKGTPTIPEIPRIPLPGNEPHESKPQGEPRFEYNSTQSDYRDSSPIDDLAKEDIRKSRTIGKYSGAAAGAIIGHYVGQNNADSDIEKGGYILGGAFLGGLIGDQVGRKVGKIAANRRKQYASEYDYLESEIQASERAISVRQQDIAETDAKILQRQARITELKNKRHLKESELQEARILKAQIDQEIEENSIKIIQYEEKLAYLESTLKESEVEKNASEEERALWAQKHRNLTEKKAELKTQFASLQTQGNRLKEDQDSLVAMLN